MAMAALRGCAMRLLRMLPLVCVICLATGCVLPGYHHPQGFSSSYYRHLQRSHGYATESVTPVAAEPATPVIPTPPAPGITD